MFQDSVWSYMLLVVLGVLIMAYVGQYLVNRIHEPYVEETEEGVIVYMYRTARRGGRYYDYTFTEKDGRYVFVPKISGILLYGGCMILVAAMFHRSFAQSGRSPEELVKLILLFGFMMLGVSLEGPIMAYLFLRREY